MAHMMSTNSFKEAFRRHSGSIKDLRNPPWVYTGRKKGEGGLLMSCTFALTLKLERVLFDCINERLLTNCEKRASRTFRSLDETRRIDQSETVKVARAVKQKYKKLGAPPSRPRNPCCPLPYFIKNEP